MKSNLQAFSEEKKQFTHYKCVPKPTQSRTTTSNNLYGFTWNMSKNVLSKKHYLSENLTSTHLIVLAELFCPTWWLSYIFLLFTRYWRSKGTVWTLLNPFDFRFLFCWSCTYLILGILIHFWSCTYVFNFNIF